MGKKKLLYKSLPSESHRSGSFSWADANDSEEFLLSQHLSAKSPRILDSNLLNSVSDSEKVTIPLVSVEKIPGEVSSDGQNESKNDNTNRVFMDFPPLESGKVFKNSVPANSNAKKSWVSFFSDNRKLGCGLDLNFLPPNEKDTVIFEEDEWYEDASIWDSALIGQVLGINIKFKAMEAFVQKVWSHLALPKICILKLGLFLYKFKSKEDMMIILESGPWFFGSRPLLLKPWSIDEEIGKRNDCLYPMWIQLPGLRLNLWNAKCISKIASLIGKPIATDKLTASRQRLEYARVLVEVSMPSPLPDHISIQGPKGKNIIQKAVDKGKEIIQYSGNNGNSINDFQPERFSVHVVHDENLNDHSSRNGVDIQQISSKSGLLQAVHVEECAQQSETSSKQIIGSGKNVDNSWILVQGSRVKRNASPLFSSCSDIDPSVIALLETKIKESKLSNSAKRIANDWKWLSNVRNSSKARILILWDHRILDTQVVNISDQQITCAIKYLDGRLDCVISSVYGFNQTEGRKELWADLIQIQEIIGNVPWLICGDFNVMIDKDDSDQQITCAIKSLDGRLDCVISSVYGFNQTEGRKELWADLIQIQEIIGNVPWLICGDFNAMIDKDDKLGGAVLSDSDTRDFNNCIKDCHLNHMKTLGFFYTWNNKQEAEARVWSRLDRALVNDQWITAYNSSYAEYLLPHFSDHSPGLISIYEDCLQGKKSFKFFKMWTKHADYLPTVSNTKLKMLKEALKVLNKRHFYNISEQVQRAKLVLEDTQEKLQNNPLDTILIRREKENLSSYNKFLLGTSVATSPPDRNIIKTGPCLTETQVRDLSKPVSKEEIKEAIFSMSDNKAPGPDGYSASFFKTAWPIIGEDILKSIGDFFRNGKILFTINSTSITLVPKVQCPKTPADFRPIACCNCLYKFISKVLANRIKSVMGYLVDEAQSAFVKGRQISSNISLAHELFKSYNRKHISPRVMLNIDINKAFDTIS
ncbi:uncharacterized protein LOC109821445 [Asparagus officinalis]|uniref:uncharacterized protein LOC109821445 n=1 Tax=Asparagus officinalis TaxID=4686 RepID=UPI00098E0771|nr:uncharacterized protein LOC109821445 [Asparagus officinalis]